MKDIGEGRSEKGGINREEKEREERGREGEVRRDGSREEGWVDEDINSGR